jgi:hypothetical protein
VESGAFLNDAIFTPCRSFQYSYGWSQPNATYNVGADLTLTPKVVATTRFGYFFTNYHDFGWLTTGADLMECRWHRRK